MSPRNHSALRAINLVAVVKFIKDYSMNAVLTQMVNDLKKKTGKSRLSLIYMHVILRLKYPRRMVTYLLLTVLFSLVFGTLAATSADNLGNRALGGFKDLLLIGDTGKRMN